MHKVGFPLPGTKNSEDVNICSYLLNTDNNFNSYMMANGVFIKQNVTIKLNKLLNA